MRRIASALTVLSAALMFEVAFADDIAVPVGLQASLLSKVVTYDRNLAERAGDRIHTLLVGKSKDPTSMPFIRQMRQALGEIDTFGPYPHDEEIVEFTDAAALAEKCRTERISIVYLGPGLHDDIDAIRNALEGLSILTVSASPDEVLRGIVLGFDLVQGKPKLVIHLPQARKQHVNMQSDLLKLMRIVQTSVGSTSFRLGEERVISTLGSERFE
jgi:hypothetical protein